RNAIRNDLEVVFEDVAHLFSRGSAKHQTQEHACCMRMRHRYSGAGRNPVGPCAEHAKTISWKCFAQHLYWIPVFAGMTTFEVAWPLGCKKSDYRGGSRISRT